MNLDDKIFKFIFIEAVKDATRISIHHSLLRQKAHICKAKNRNK